jgi:uroporphyrinogen decarboxylase
MMTRADAAPLRLRARERFVRACRGEATDRAPVWLMRQAGRYLPEYRELRSRLGFLDLCRSPDLAAEVSLQPYRRFGMDGVVVFGDILVPLSGLGLDFEFAPGPTTRRPIRDEEDLARLDGSVAEAMAPTCDAIRALRAELGEDAAVIGFAGAPWTLAAYASEEKLSRDLVALGALSYREPRLCDALLDRMAEITAETLRVQAEAGADALQIFDTWAGVLSRERFRRFAGRALKRVLESLPEEGPPVTLYARGAPHLLDELVDLGADVVSLDWRIDLADAAARVDGRVSLQGNLDPAALQGSPASIRAAVARILEAGRKARGHILNLGHGVQPQTPVEGVAAFVEAAREASP